MVRPPVPIDYSTKYNPNHIFADMIACTTYFTANPEELISGLWVCIGDVSYRRVNDAWLVKTKRGYGIPQ